MKILIVDDYKTMRRIIRNLLGQIGHTNVYEAVDVQDALIHLRRDDAEPFGVVICDHNLTYVATGLDLLQEARSEFPDLPFLMLTPESNPDFLGKLATHLKNCGPASYLIKPFNATKLEEALVNLFQTEETKTFAL